MATSAAPTAAWMPAVGTHSVTIGSSMRRSLMNSKPSPPHTAQSTRGDFVAMRYNLKPPSVTNATGSLVPTGEYTQKDSFQLELNAETGERHSFNVRSETKKELDCVLFWDPQTKTLVLERLDSLLQATHQRTANKPLPNNRTGIGAGPGPGVGHGHGQPTGFPPTPPSMSPPEYSSLPESSRPKHGETRPARAKPDSGTPTIRPGGPTPDKGPSSSMAGSTGSSSSTSSGLKVPRTMSDYAQEQRKRQESRPTLSKRSASDFASDPDEEILTFGKPSVPTAPSSNALHLSEVPVRRTKRKHGPGSDEEPDEEELEFGRPSKEIKRPKTASQSPTSVAYGTPAMAHGELATSPRQPTFTGAKTTASSSVYMPPKMINGSSPLATAPVYSADSASDDDDDDDSSSDSEVELAPPTFTPNYMNQPIEIESYGAVDGDGDEDDFLAAAFNNNEDTVVVQGDGDQSDDSSDESDYAER